MEAQKGQQEKQPSPVAQTSCRRKKSEEVTFLEDLKDHIDEFINASMDEHKTCFKKTIQKMFGMSKVVAERSSHGKEVEISLPLQTTVYTSSVDFYGIISSVKSTSIIEPEDGAKPLQNHQVA